MKQTQGVSVKAQYACVNAKQASRRTNGSKRSPSRVLHGQGQHTLRSTRRASGVKMASASDLSVISDKEVDSYHQKGFLTIQNWASQEEVSALRQRAQSLMDDFDPSVVSVFSTKRQESVMKEDAARNYFLDSASDIGFFFEEGAFDDDGNLKQSKQKSINKIGHALHDLDPVFREFSRSTKMTSLLQTLGYQKPIPVQSMYICKQPRIGGEVVPHQDSTFLYTSPPSVIGIWLALEDATIANGCLWGLSGSHQEGIDRRMTLNSNKEIVFDKDPVQQDLSKYKAIEVPAGTLVIFHGSFYHMSYENKSEKSRHAYTFHVVEGAEGYEWATDNWLQRRSDFPFEPL